MSSQTVAGAVTGTLVGVGGAMTPLGDLPFLFYLEKAGVSSPYSCLNWIKEGTSTALLHPCFPLSDPGGLAIMSNILVFIALGLIVFGLFQIKGQLN